jgi:hypothetical protein
MSNMAGAVAADPATQLTSCQTPIINVSVTVVKTIVAVGEVVNMSVAMVKGAPVNLSIIWNMDDPASVPTNFTYSKFI